VNKLAILFVSGVLAVLASCAAREEAKKTDNKDDQHQKKTMTPRQQALVDMDPSAMTIAEIVELAETLPGYAEFKLRNRIDERVNWDQALKDWNLSKLSEAEKMVWRLIWLDREIGNGGLSQFFSNKGTWTLQIVKDLETLGCKPVQAWFHEALSVVPNAASYVDPHQLASALNSAYDREGVSTHWMRLNDLWYQAGDTESLETEIGFAIARYFIANKEEFQ
jgi:hypothetical protein